MNRRKLFAWLAGAATAAVVPASKWVTSPASRLATPAEIVAVLGVDPEIEVAYTRIFGPTLGRQIYYSGQSKLFVPIADRLGDPTKIALDWAKEILEGE